MGSLSKCLKKAGLSEHENAILRGATKDNRDAGDEEHEAAVKAVLDHVESLLAERQDIVDQIDKLGGEAPKLDFDMDAAKKIVYGDEDPLNNRDVFSFERVVDNGSRVEMLSFRRGEEVKVAGRFPMTVGKITGISHANRQIKVGSIWHDYGYIYKQDYDEYAAPRAEIEKDLSRLEDRIKDGNTIEYQQLVEPIQKNVKKFGLDSEFNERIDDLYKARVRLERFAERQREEKRQAEDEAKAAKAEQDRIERENAKPVEPVKMTMAEWKKTSKDYKTILDGTRMVLRPGGMVPVEIVKEEQAPVSEESVDEATLEEIQLLRKWGDSWQYKFVIGSGWMTANTKEDAVKIATATYFKTPQSERLTRAQRSEKADADEFSGMSQRYGKLSLDELRNQYEKMGGEIASLQRSGAREMNENGGRRTGAAVSAQGAREVAEERMRLGRYIKTLEEQNIDESNPTAEQQAKIPPLTIEKGEVAMEPTWDSFADFWNGMIDGKGSIADVQEAFGTLLDRADEMKSSISKLKNDQLKRMLGWSARPGDKKSDMVSKLYNSTLPRFTLNKESPSKQWSYGDNLEKVEREYNEKLREIVNSLTDADLAEFRNKIAENTKEREEALEEQKAAVADPKTLEDFNLYAANSRNTGKTLAEARKALTPEQRALWDSLAAEKSRTERNNRIGAQKSDVSVAAVTTDGQVIETKHTKTGEPLFVVKAAERVAPDIYKQWNATAKRLGGYYSSFRGNGAVPGFQFKTRENADAFLKFLGGDVEEAKAVVQERRDAFADDRSQSAVERLNEMADRLEDSAIEALNRDRKTNTNRRADMAARAESAARSQEALSKTMRNIAGAIDSGSAKFLDRVRQKTQVEMLQDFIRSAKDDEIRTAYPSYVDQERHRGEPATIDTAEYAAFPRYTLYRSDLANLGRKLIETDGTKKIGQQILKVADDVTDAYLKFAKDNFDQVAQFRTSEGSRVTFPTRDLAEAAIARSGYRGKAIAYQVKRGEHAIIFSPTEAQERGIWPGDGDKKITFTAEFGAELVEKLGKLNRGREKVAVPWQFENTYDRLKKLAGMGIETPAEFRSALREFINLREQPKEEDRIKKLERAMLGRKNDGLDFFPTAGAVTDTLLDTADFKEGMSIYEPHAGMGHIADRIREAGFEPDVGELDPSRRELLEAKGYSIVSRDFLDTTLADTPDGAGYDRIIMNPPFSDRRDAAHVKHAMTLLKPGGRLVSVVGEGVFFGQDKKAQAFRDWLDEVGGTSEKLPEGSFLDPSLPVNTGVNARMVVVDLPESDSTRANPDVSYSIPSKQRQIDTPEFKKWFGDSKVVDADGKPLVVYHGSPDVRGIFSEGFKAKSRGSVFFAAKDYAVANSYADDRRAFDYQNAEPQTIPLYVSIKNPMIVDAKGAFWKDTERHVEEAKAAGHDGIIIKNTVDFYNNMRGKGSPTTVYAWFAPEQAKSAVDGQMRSRVDQQPIPGAIGNNGDFDPNNPDIRFSLQDDSQNSTDETPSSIRAELVSTFGEKGIAILEDSGLLQIMPIADAPSFLELSGTEEGAYDASTGKAYLFADRLTKARAIPVLAHEIGEHHGLRNVIGAGGWSALKKRIAVMARNKGSMTEGIWKGVLSNYSEFDGWTDEQAAQSDKFIHEVIAKLGESDAGRKTSAWRDVVIWVRKFLLNTFGISTGINEEVVSSLVNGSLKRIMGGDGPRGGGRSIDGDFVMASNGVSNNSLDNSDETINMDDIPLPIGDENAFKDAESLFLSSFPKSTRTYRSTTGTARAAKAVSDAVRRQIDMDPGADRTVSSPLGPFTGFTTRAKRTKGLDGREQLLIQVFGKEQIEAGLDYAPALSMTLDVDQNKRVEYSIYGPPSQSNLYKQFERRGWAEPARDADGDIIRTLDDGFWTKLSGSNREETIQLLGDAHGRALEWLGEERIGIHWKRTTGATGTSTGREGSVYFSKLFDPIGYVTKAETKIVGDSGRYTDKQREFFRNVGREVTKESIQDRVKSLWKDAGKKLAQGIVDQFAPIKDISDKAYTLLRLSKGAAGAFEAFLKHGKLSIDADGVYDASNTGGVIDTVFSPLQAESEDFLWWVAANRAERLSAEDRENLFTEDDIEVGKSLADGETEFDYTLKNGPKAGEVTRNRQEIYADSLITFNEFHQNAMDIAEQSGLIDGEARKYWEHEFYVPFYRAADDKEGFRGANLKNGSVRQTAFKRLKGGSDKLNSDLLANTLQNWAHLIDASAKNRAAKASLEAAVAVGAAEQVSASAIPTGETGAVWHMGDIIRTIPKGTTYEENGVTKVSDGTATIKEHGQVHYIVTDPFILTALTSLEYAGIKGRMMDAMSTMKHWLTVGVTASPAFKIRNLIRDSLQAIGTAELSYNPLKNLKQGNAAVGGNESSKNFLKTIANAATAGKANFKLNTEKSDEYVSMLASGALIRFGSMLEGREADRARKLIKSGVKDSTILDSESKWRRVYDEHIEPMISAYNELGNRSEEITRAALYQQLRDQGKSHAYASLMARDLMDFSMQGAFPSVRLLTQVVPFMNARLQGLYKLGKSAKEDPRRFGIVLGAIATASITLMAFYSDDDDWKKREDWDRDTYWWFKLGDVAFRVPKPFELGAIATIAERGVELFTNDEMTKERFFERVRELASNSLAMSPVPQMIKPIVDVYANKDSFSGRPIETMGMEKLRSDYRYTSNTTMPARAISTAGNAVTGIYGGDFLSPVQVDHMIRGYFGWLGSFVVGSADMATRIFNDEPATPSKDAWRFATQGILSEVDGASSRYVSQMYEQAKILEEAYGTHRDMIKRGKAEEAAEFAENHASALKRYKEVEHVKKTISVLNRAIRNIENNLSLSKQEKKDRIRQYQQQKDKVARRVAIGTAQ